MAESSEPPTVWTALLRFALRLLSAAIVVAIVVALSELYFVVAADLPENSWASGWFKLGALPFLGLPLVGFAVGWAWRGAGVLGAPLGVVLGGLAVLWLGDPLTRAIDPRSISMFEGGDGAAAIIPLAGTFFGFFWMPVAGLIGWAIHVAIRRLPRPVVVTGGLALVAGLVGGLAVALAPMLAAQSEWDSCQRNIDIHPFCGQSPTPNWTAGVLVGALICALVVGLVRLVRAAVWPTWRRST